MNRTQWSLSPYMILPTKSGTLNKALETFPNGECLDVVLLFLLRTFPHSRCEYYTYCRTYIYIYIYIILESECR